MSIEEIQRLEAEELELAEKLRKLREQKTELRRIETERQRQEELRQEQEKEITITVMEFNHRTKTVVLKNSVYRTDVVEAMKNIPGRSYGGSGKNTIPLDGFLNRLKAKLEDLPNVWIEYESGVQERIDWFHNAPDYEVKIAPVLNATLEVRVGPRIPSWSSKVSGIPSAKFDSKENLYNISANEGWRVWDALKDLENVVWEEAAKVLILEQIEQRTKLDRIAKSEDCSPEFLELIQKALSREVWNPRTQEYEEFWSAMMPFQRVGLEFMYVSGGRNLLGDGTGLGKTWQTLAYSELKRYLHKQDGSKEFQTICVVKASNIPNWRREIKNLTGETGVECYSSSPGGVEVKQVALDRAPYVIISYDTLGAYFKKGKKKWDDEQEKYVPEFMVYPWSDIFNTAKPDLLILDEAHQIKSEKTHRWKAVRGLHDTPHIISATASFVLNRVQEYWTNLHMNDPEIWSTKGAFERMYTDGHGTRNAKELHELLRPVFIRRTKKDVLKDLPPINRIHEYKDLSEKAQRLYSKALAMIYERIAAYDVMGQGGDEMNIMNFLSQITRLKQICAIDKAEYTADLAVSIIDEWDDENPGDRTSKILIFSHFKGCALNIANRLGHEAVCTVKRGNKDFVSLGSEERDELFENARRNPRVRYIVTTEAAKEGHNLEFCNWVIFNDLFWTPAAHDQCEGRAYGRLANPHPIDSYYIIADVDVEKWIMELLDEKLRIIAEAVDGVESSRDESLSIGRGLFDRLKAEMSTIRKNVS